MNNNRQKEIMGSQDRKEEGDQEKRGVYSGETSRKEGENSNEAESTSDEQGGVDKFVFCT